ncbi:phage tail tip lysozyme [Paraburkholderia caribensis]|uniref:phage tail tip lysozyme n=1 Tax=Paraburkholderia caribensis TaxID=75105 RepID=UPI001D05EB52|nr:phage tail tip lysozyme [Paraburkholderia caribensis]
MATIVDALVVTLGLDLSNFTKGKADATKATKTLTAEEKEAGKQIEEANKRAAESFKKVRNEVLSLLAIFTAGMGIKNFTESTIASAANLGFLAKNLQMSTKDLSAWQRAAERAGGSAEGITAALQDSQQQVAKFKIGQVTEGVQAFLRWGGSVNDLKDGNTYLLARSRIIKSMFDVDPARAKLVAQQMGIGDGEFNFIRQGTAAILALVEAQKKNSAISEDQAEKALKLKNAWLDFSDRLKYVGTTVLLELMPVFEKWLEKLQALADWVADHKADIVKWVDDAVASVQRFVEWADKAADSVGGWKNVLIALGTIKVLSAVSPLLQLAGALGSVGGALGVLGGAAAVAGLGTLAALAGIAVGKIKDSTEPGHFVGRNAGAPIPKPLRESDTNASLWSSVKNGVKSFFSTEGGHFVSRTAGADQQRARVALDYFMSQGWSREQAAGMVGSLLQESSVDPTSRNPKSGAYGIGQWLGSRVDDFRKWSGHDLQGSSLQEQLAFMQYELTQGKEIAAGKLLRGARTASDAASIHATAYERPGAAEANIAQRQAYAASLLAGIGQANAAQIATQGVGARDLAPAPSNVSTSTSSAETNINGPISIHTQATDAAGIARDLSAELRRFSFTVPQANTGVN